MKNGISFSSVGSIAQLKPHLAALNVEMVLAQVPWKDVEPVVYDSPVYKWDKWDTIINSLSNRLVLVVGQGDDAYRPISPNGSRISPDNDYRYIYLNARMIKAMVERYKHRVHDWAIMAEANEYPLRVRYGWISGSKWLDHDWLTSLAKASYKAIKHANSNTNVVIMFHTDIHSDIHHDFPKKPGDITGSMLAGKYDWLECAEMWKPYYDTLGIDTYPNYYISDQIYSRDVGDKVEQGKRIKDSVWITETQYPFSKLNLPYPVGWTEEKQCRYLKEAYHYAEEAGAEAFFVFNLFAGGVVGMYDEFDLKVLDTLGRAFRNGDAKTLLDFLFANYQYCITKLGKVLAQTEKGLGLSNSAAYDTVKKLYSAGGIMTPTVHYTRHLETGWSRISFPINKHVFKGDPPKTCPPDAEMVKVESLSEWLSSIITPPDAWEFMNDNAGRMSRTLPDQFSSLKIISPYKAYEIKVSENAVINMDGKPFLGPTPLDKGWNLVGIPINKGYYDTETHPDFPWVSEWQKVDAPVAEFVLESIKGKYKNIMGDNGAYSPNLPATFSSLHWLAPGCGYWINVTEDCLLKGN